MSKYILSPSGKIIKQGEEAEPTSITREMLSTQEDFFSLRRGKNTTRIGSASVSLPTSLRSKEPARGIIASETAVLEEEKYEGEIVFPNKISSDGVNNNLLISSAFASDLELKYYVPYNSIFSKVESNRRVYAEELEMIAGLDLNSLGIVLSGNSAGDIDIDLTQILIVFDFLIESLAYLVTYWVMTNVFEGSSSPIQTYFREILNVNKITYKGNLLSLINYYIVGFDKFINTDPKLDINPKKYKMSDNSIFVSGKYLINTFLNLSKIGRNRTFLLLRKFQQESYWQTEILYKAKKETSENFLDKFFIEFSQYYFKFILERINIGYITLELHRNDYGSIDFLTRHFDRPKIKKYYKKSLETDLFLNDRDIKSNNNKHAYSWEENIAVKSSKNKTSILSLPNLLKSNEYFVQKTSLSKQEIAQNFTRSKKGERRLPVELVKKIEEYMESEYMPFYMHDLRTNEVLSMHAFLDSISDSFSPNYNESKGYGRIDAVRHYVDTTRSINLGFTLYATNVDDFDFMWYQINKIVSMVYPQWSQGVPAQTGDLKDIKGFRYPFTQMPTASPLIRLRVGDVIKTNFSFESLKRLHGNSKEVSMSLNSYYISFNSSRPSYVLKKDKIKHGEHLKIYDFLRSIRQDPNDNRFFGEVSQIIEKLQDKRITSKQIAENQLKFEDDEVLLERLSVDDFAEAVGMNKFIISGLNGAINSELYNLLLDKFIVYKYTFKNSIGEIKDAFDINNLTTLAKNTINKTGYIFYDDLNVKTKNLKLWKDTLEQEIFEPEVSGKINNPYTKSFESASGKGLAGFITSLNVEYQDMVWNTNSPGSNAPRGVKITLGFAPVHDIPPGLDHEGIMRAPVYDVGSINNNMFSNSDRKTSGEQ